MINANSRAASVAKRVPRKHGRPTRQHWENRLRLIRETHNLSQATVAKECDLTLQAFWDIERGRDPKLTTAKRIAEFFGVPIEEIWVRVAE